jgi:hypothetical protein
MNKLMQTVLLVLVGLTVLAAASPALIKLVKALPSFILVAGVVVTTLRIVWFYTRQ